MENEEPKEILEIKSQESAIIEYGLIKIALSSGIIPADVLLSQALGGFETLKSLIKIPIPTYIN